MTTLSIGRTSNAAAFTLIELLIVVAIMGIMLAAALPRLGGAAQTFELEETRASLQRLVTHAQSQAIITRSAVRLNFDAERRSYWLSIQKEPPCGADFVRPAEPTFATHAVPHRVRVRVDCLGMADAREFLVFMPDGNVTLATLVLSNEAGDTATVKLVSYYGERVLSAKTTN